MKKLILLSIILILLSLPVYAHCPLCTAAIGAGAVTAKYYGMDMTIIGLFIGAFAISTGLWVGGRIKKNYIKFQLHLIVLLSFLLTVIPLISVDDSSVYFPLLLSGESGSMLNKVYWVNKILLGSIFGGAITMLSFWLHNYIKKVRSRVLFPYQGIAITLLFLIITGITFYFIF